MAFARHSSSTPTGRRRPVLITTALAAVVTLLSALVVTQPAFAAGSITATFTSAGDWGTGHQVNVTVTNSGSAAVNGWTLEFDLPAGDTISSSWDADVTRSGNHYMAKNKSWAGTLAPAPGSAGATTAPARSSRRRHCTINGVAVQRGRPRHHEPPTTTPTPTRPPRTPTPTPTPTTHDAAARRQEGRRLLRRVGRLRPQLPREEHRDERLGREADPHPLRVRQHHRRPVLDR